MKRLGKWILFGAYLLVNFLIAAPLWCIGFIIWQIYLVLTQGKCAAEAARLKHADELGNAGREVLNWFLN